MRRIAAILLALTMTFPAFAQSGGKHDSSKPIEINADSLEVLQKDQQAIFRGNVVAVQGQINLRSEKMTVFYREKGGAGANGIAKIIVEGKVFMATPQETAQGEKGIYDVDRKEITLLNNVVLTRDKNVLKGSRLDYNLGSGRSIVTGGVSAQGAKTGGRVRGLFVPNK